MSLPASICHFLCICFLATGLQGQDNKQLVHSIEGGLQRAIFDPGRGFSVKANHHWHENGISRFQMGLMLSALSRPGASPDTRGTKSEFFGVSKLNLHAGWVKGVGQRQKLYGWLEGYVGLRTYLTVGSVDQPSQNFSRDYSDLTHRADLGLRLGLGYQITERIGVQGAVNTSLIDVNHPLGPPTGIFFWGPDALSLLELSVSWQLGN